MQYIVQLADALVYLHERNHIHADVRVDNILVADSNTIKLNNSCVFWKLRGQMNKKPTIAQEFFSKR